MNVLMSLLVLHSLLGSEPGAYPPSLLNLEPGSRAAAMAGAGAEFGRDAAAAFYNPAGLGLLPAVAASFEDNSSASISEFERDHHDVGVASTRRYWSAAAGLPLPGRLALGFSATGFELDRHFYPHWWHMPGILDNDRQLSLRLAASWRPHPRFAFGIAGRQNRSSTEWRERDEFPRSPVETVAAEGRSYSVDLGILADAPLPAGRLRGAVAGLNFGTRHEYGYENRTPTYDTLPWTIRMSAGYSLGIGQLWPGAPGRLRSGLEPYRDWLVDNWNAELNYTFKAVRSDPLVHAVGLEVRPLPVLAARVGYVYAPIALPSALPDVDPPPETCRQGWTWGVGLDFKFARASVAWDEPLHAPSRLPYRPRYELALSIGEPLLREHGLLR